ncbi:MAG: hypothetical protein P4L65_05280 [Legionella sp.]|nr:hypothetical protein [Legionella sp.]
MIYLWEHSEHYAYQYKALYNAERPAECFSFKKDRTLTYQEALLFNLDLPQSEITTKYDCIPNTSGLPLVNQKVMDLLLELTPDEVQFFDTKIQCSDEVLTHYKLLNATHSFAKTSRAHSLASIIHDDPDAFLGFRYLTYQPECMGNLKLARSDEYRTNLLVTADIKHAFEAHKIKGARFIEPTHYYC